MGIKKKSFKGNGSNENSGIVPGRRKFIKNTLFTITGTGLASVSSAKSLSGKENKKEDIKFLYRTLGKTGIRLPVVSMGTGNTNSASLVRSALDKGINLLATSSYYQNGNNERMIGSVIKDRSRDSFKIMTGVGELKWIDTKTGELKPNFDPKEYMQKVDESLKRLHVDYVDILVQPFSTTRKSVLSKPFRKVMDAIKKSGKTKYIAIATHRLEHEAIRAAVDSGAVDIVMTAYNFRRRGWHSEQNGKKLDEAIQYAAQSGLGIIAMKTMAGAYWDKERTRPINSNAALKWVLQNKNIHTTVPDCSSYEHLEKNLGIMRDIRLTEEEKRDLNPPSKELISGLFCQQCNRCMSQCPAEIDIPTIMRSYMYAYGYRNLELARETLNHTGLNSIPCVECSDCQVSCTMEFDIRSKILDISRLKSVPEDLIRNA